MADEITELVSDEDRPVTGSGLPTSITITLPPKTEIRQQANKTFECTIQTDPDAGGNPNPYKQIKLNQVKFISALPDQSGVGYEVIVELIPQKNFGLCMGDSPCK